LCLSSPAGGHPDEASGEDVLSAGLEPLFSMGAGRGGGGLVGAPCGGCRRGRAWRRGSFAECWILDSILSLPIRFLFLMCTKSLRSKGDLYPKI
jgi:hypothetical protein